MAINQFNWIEIDQKNLLHNLSHLYHRLSDKVKLMAVIKDNAYGHDSLSVGRFLEEKGHGEVSSFAVHSVGEAMALRNEKVTLPILVIGPATLSEVKDAAQHNITISVFSNTSLSHLNSLPNEIKCRVPVHLKVDTGMSRLGFHSDEMKAVLELVRSENINVTGLFSHMPDAQNEDTVQQIQKFSEITNAVRSVLGPNITTHLANSLGTIYHPDAHCDLVRVGLSLYGYAGNRPYGEAHLKPVLRLCSKIIQIRDVPVGGTVGYNRQFKVKRNSKIAVVPIGYGDGYLRCYRNYGQVIIKKECFPIVGDICMDMLMVDITDAGESLEVNETVQLIGENANERISAYHLSKSCGFIPYEILTLLPKHIPRKWVS